MARRKQLGDIDTRCTSETISVRRVPLNRGGYTSEGRYFGVGEPLFFFSGSDPQTGNFGYARGASRDAVKAKLRAKCPSFKFKR
jgi:hypothetical protein